MMNMLDLVILGIVALCAFAGYRRGLIRTVYRLVSFFIALFLAYQLFPYAARLLRNTALFPWIQDGIIRAMNFEAFFNEHTMTRAVEVIDTLPFPVMMRNLLHNHNTPNMFELLRVDVIEEYIAGIFAGIAINAIAVLVVFMVAMLVLSIAGAALDIVSYLPVINTFNRAGGLALGLVMGAGLAWVGILVMTVLLTTGAHDGFYEMLESSVITRWLNEIALPRLAYFAANV